MMQFANRGNIGDKTSNRQFAKAIQNGRPTLVPSACAQPLTAFLTTIACAVRSP